MMICDRCYRPADTGAHGYGLCPLEPRRFGLAVRPDDIPGGLWIEHGLCNADGTPRRYDSRSAIARECQVRGLVPWTEVYEERRTKEGKEHADWMRSSEARRAREGRQELRHERAMKRQAEARR